jgi:precorrin-6A/cobalt-precorrin-6A reductase
VTILILGGTAEARELAAALVTAGAEVLTSLAGRVSRPALPVGRVRIGGFGGADGLAAFLTASRIAAMVDATHPFAARISANGATAAARTGTPLLRLERPGWADHPLAGTWTWVPDAQAARLAADGARRPFLTTGRQSLWTFLATAPQSSESVPWMDRAVVVRVVDPPAVALPPTWTMIISRGPYRFEDERQLVIDHRIDTLITKDSGGSQTVAKLEAAHDLAISVVIIRRPAPGAEGSTATTVDQAVTWLRAPRAPLDLTGSVVSS